MSAVRLGPVMSTISPRESFAAQDLRNRPPGGGQMLGKLIHTGDNHAGRRQVAHQPLLGRRTMHDARAGVGQQCVSRDQPGRKLLDLRRCPVGRHPVHAIGGNLGREFPSQAGGPSCRVRAQGAVSMSWASCRRASAIVGQGMASPLRASNSVRN